MADIDTAATTTTLADRVERPALLRILSIVGRLAIVYLFFGSAIYHLTVGYRSTIADMAARGVPFTPVLMVLAMVLCAALPLALLFNFQARWAALGLALYTFIVSWTMYTPGSNAAGPNTIIFFMKDMAIFGALLALYCALALNHRLAARLRERGTIS